MKKVFQKNQMIIMTLAVVIAVAGYVNYSQKYESGWDEEWQDEDSFKECGKRKCGSSNG